MNGPHDPTKTTNTRPSHHHPTTPLLTSVTHHRLAPQPDPTETSGTQYEEIATAEFDASAGQEQRPSVALVSVNRKEPLVYTIPLAQTTHSPLISFSRSSSTFFTSSPYPSSTSSCSTNPPVSPGITRLVPTSAANTARLEAPSSLSSSSSQNRANGEAGPEDQHLGINGQRDYEAQPVQQSRGRGIGHGHGQLGQSATCTKTQAEFGDRAGRGGILGDGSGFSLLAVVAEQVEQAEAASEAAFPSSAQNSGSRLNPPSLQGLSEQAALTPDPNLQHLSSPAEYIRPEYRTDGTIGFQIKVVDSMNGVGDQVGAGMDRDFGRFIGTEHPSFDSNRLHPPNLRSSAELGSGSSDGLDLYQQRGESGVEEIRLKEEPLSAGAEGSFWIDRTESTSRAAQDTTPTPSISGEPVRTKIKPKGRGKRKAEEEVQAEVATGGVPNPSLGREQDGSMGNPSGQSGHSGMAGIGLPLQTAGGGQFNPASNGYYNSQLGGSSSQYPYDHNIHGQRPMPSPPPSRSAPGEMTRAGGGLLQYNAIAGPSYVSGLPPAYTAADSQPPKAKQASGKGKTTGSNGGKIFYCRNYGPCESFFSRSEHLARHVRKHTGEKPFTCHCSKAFSRLDNLRQHAATTHSDCTEMNERMLRSLAPIHAALSQRATRDQKQRGEVVSVPKSAAEKTKASIVKRARETKSIKSHQHTSSLPELPVLPPTSSYGSTYPPGSAGTPGFVYHQSGASMSLSTTPAPPHHGEGLNQRPLTASFIQPGSGSGMIRTYPQITQSHSQPQLHSLSSMQTQPDPTPFQPPTWAVSPALPSANRSTIGYRPETSNRPGSGVPAGPQRKLAPVTTPVHGHGQMPSASQSTPSHHRSATEQPAGLKFHPFPHGIRPGSELPVPLQLAQDQGHIGAGPASAGISAASGDGRFPDRPGTASSYLSVPSGGMQAGQSSAGPYVSGFQGHLQMQPNSATFASQGQPPNTADVYGRLVGTGTTIGRPETDMMQQQQPYPTALQAPAFPGMHQNYSATASHSSSGDSSQYTGHSSHLQSLGPASHRQIQEIYGNSGATQESPFSYHPPPTASHPPPPGTMTGAISQNFNGAQAASGLEDYGLPAGDYTISPSVRKRRSDELKMDGYGAGMDRRKFMEGDADQIAGAFYAQRGERRTSVAISSLVSEDNRAGHVQPSSSVEDLQQFYQPHSDNQENGGQHQTADFTFGGVGLNGTGGPHFHAYSEDAAGYAGQTQAPDMGNDMGWDGGGQQRQMAPVHREAAMTGKGQAMVGNNTQNSQFEL